MDFETCSKIAVHKPKRGKTYALMGKIVLWHVQVDTNTTVWFYERIKKKEKCDESRHVNCFVDEKKMEMDRTYNEKDPLKYHNACAEIEPVGQKEKRKALDHLG